MASNPTLNTILTNLDSLTNAELQQIQEKINNIHTARNKPDQKTLEQHNASSLLLRLPGELRNQIYRYAMSSHLNNHLHSYSYTLFGLIPKPAFFKTCTQIHVECNRLFPSAPLQCVRFGRHLRPKGLKFTRGDLERLEHRGKLNVRIHGFFESEEKAAKAMGELEGVVGAIVAVDKEVEIKPKCWGASSLKLKVDLLDKGMKRVW